MTISVQLSLAMPLLRSLDFPRAGYLYRHAAPNGAIPLVPDREICGLGLWDPVARPKSAAKRKRSANKEYREHFWGFINHKPDECPDRFPLAVSGGWP